MNRRSRIGLSGYALAVSSSWGCTVALVHRMHVRIDSVYTHLSPRIRELASTRTLDNPTLPSSELGFLGNLRLVCGRR